MEAYKCDRCGNYYEEKPSKSFAYLIIKKREYSNSSSLLITIDLCDKCRQEFMNWMYTGETSPDIVEARKTDEIINFNNFLKKHDYDKNTKLVDVIDIEKLLAFLWPESLNHRARLRNILKEKAFTLGDICLETNPKGIGKETWKKVKNYILTYVDFNA